MTPKIIDWRITSKCNQKCFYCYATDYAEKIMADVANDEKIINKIIEIGCKSVCISGGEPLLDEDGKRAYRIIKTLKDKGIANIFLSTNGINLLDIEYRFHISQYLSKLSLPVDGYDVMSTRLNGRAESFEYVKSILEYFNRSFHKGERIPNIKVSTVVTRNNINDSDYWKKMCDFINQYPIIKLWKIYDFVPENRGKTNRDKLSYSQDEFNNFTHGIECLRTHSHSVPIEIAKRNSRSQIYFIIRPDGNVIIPKDNNDVTEEVILGNLLTNNLADIIAGWNNFISSEKCKIYSIGRNISDTGVFREDDLTNCLLSKISGDSLFSRQKIIESVAKETGEDINLITTRLQSLKEGNNPVVREVIPIINLSKLRLQVYLINLVFNANSGFTVEEIADIICNNYSVGWCAHYKVLNVGESNNDEILDDKVVFRISIFASSMPECVNHLNEIIDSTRHACVSRSIDYVPEKYVAYDRILSVRENDLLDGRLIQYHMQQKKLKLTKKEKLVLIAMSSFRRTNGLCFENLLTKLQNDFSHVWRGRITSKQVNSVIDSLRTKQIINMFQLVTNDKKLGYNTFLVIYDLHPLHGEREQELKAKFEDFVKNLSGVTHVNILNAGDWDADVEIKVKTRGELSYIASIINDKFGDEIRNRQYMELIKEYKFTFMIPVVVDAL